MRILSLDVGTTQTGYAIMDWHIGKPTLVSFGKVDNMELRNTVMSELYDRTIDFVAYEEFASYGMPIGKTTMHSIQWNGRYIELAYSQKVPTYPIFRKDVKIHLCQSMKAKDSNIRQALIDRYGVVGVKANQGFFYGVAGDVWSAIAINVTFMEKFSNDAVKRLCK